MTTFPYSLSHKQRHALHSQGHVIAIAIPVSADFDGSDCDSFVRKSLGNEARIAVSNARLTQIAVEPAINPDILPPIARPEHRLSDIWHFEINVVIADIASKSHPAPQKLYDNPQWPGDLTDIYSAFRPRALGRTQ